MASLAGPPLGAVLAGGAGTRLGGGKAGAELGGRPLASYPVAALRAAGIEPVIYAKPGQPLPQLGVPVRREPAEPRHPLAGVVAALRDCATESRPLIAVACDLPFVAPDLLAALAAAPEPLVVPEAAGRPQPLLARYDPVLLGDLEAAMAAERSLTRAVMALRPRLLGTRDLARFGAPERILFNVNTGDDLERARHALPASDFVI